ncbi:MAG: thioredoxin family protein [Melioribacteraceae bacterium]
MNKTIEHFKNEKQLPNYHTYSEFVKNIEFKLIEDNYNLLSDEDKNRLDIIKINFQRMKRIQKTFTKVISSGKINTELVELISKIDEPQTWLVITEDWCGDSAQNIPYFYEYAKLNKNINFEIILRDENLDLLENYFTSGNPKSIPKIVGFDKNGNEIFIWGARPKVAQDLVMMWKAEGLDKDEFNKKLHLWYGRDRGKKLEKEIIKMLQLK